MAGSSVCDFRNAKSFGTPCLSILYNTKIEVQESSRPNRKVGRDERKPFVQQCQLGRGRRVYLSLFSSELSGKELPLGVCVVY